MHAGSSGEQESTTSSTRRQGGEERGSGGVGFARQRRVVEEDDVEFFSLHMSQRGRHNRKPVLVNPNDEYIPFPP